MDIAVVGGGGREHAIIQALRQSPKAGKIYAIPGGGGMLHDAECVPIKATDCEAITQFCAEKAVDYVVVAPDDPLALGLVDMLAAAGIPAFGPSRAAARIEASKVFAKQLMQKYNIPTAAWAAFDKAEAALAYLDDASYPIVVKADGLALGKGVVICPDAETARSAVLDMMENGAFGAAGRTVVLEQYLTGPEVSVLAFCDGKTLAPMVSSMDHKRALDGDEGPNTGGMGAVAPNPYYTPQIAQQCMDSIFMPTLRAMEAEGAPFKGCLYFGLMLTADGPRVIEYNCRFGDPETQVVLPLLQADLLEIMLSCTNGTLSADMVRFSADAAACVIMASGGYPGSYTTGQPIKIFEKQNEGDLRLFFAGAAVRDGELVTSGGRVLGVCAVAPTLRLALYEAYAAVRHIHFEGAHYRTDIGRAALAALGE